MFVNIKWQAISFERVSTGISFSSLLHFDQYGLLYGMPIILFFSLSQSI